MLGTFIKSVSGLVKDTATAASSVATYISNELKEAPKSAAQGWEEGFLSSESKPTTPAKRKPGRPKKSTSK